MALITFDNPHFREDTDFAWRLLNHGKIPYARDVIVYHPPHPRNIKRESLEERAKFFEKDALLAKKHPYNCIWILENLELRGINWKDYVSNKAL